MLEMKLEVLSIIAKELGMPIGEEKMKKFLKYGKIIKKWGLKISLLSKKDLDEIEKHFIDSIFLLLYIKGNELADLGTGAGLPGIPLKIMRPNITLHMVERSFKKSIFLKNTVRELGLNKIIIHMEDWKNCFLSVDTAFTKATGSLKNLLQEVNHIIKPGGKFIVYSSSRNQKIGNPKIVSFLNPLRKSESYLLIYEGKDV